MGLGPDSAPNLERWLEHTAASKLRLERELDFAATLPVVDRLSQLHVLQQIEHLKSYPCVAERLADQRIRLHAWWFDLTHAEVLSFNPAEGGFVPLVDLL